MSKIKQAADEVEEILSLVQECADLFVLGMERHYPHILKLLLNFRPVRVLVFQSHRRRVMQQINNINQGSTRIH